MEPTDELTRVHVVSIAPASHPSSGEHPVLIVASSADFDRFYPEARSSVGRALALTLGDADLAAECVDEAMVRAFQRWRRVGGLENPAGWVYRVAYNQAMGAFRRRRRRDDHARRHGGDASGGRFGADALTAGVDPDIAAALDRLPVDQRATVVCRLVLDWSERQTATALGVRPGTVKSRLSRALDRLHDDLAHLEPEDRR